MQTFNEVGMLPDSFEVHILKIGGEESFCGLTGDWWIVYEYQESRLCESCKQEHLATFEALMALDDRSK